MSRKTFIGIAAIVEAVLLFLKEQFGLAIDAKTLIASLVFLIGYFVWELRLDIKRVSAQIGKFHDPKFWLGIATVLIFAFKEAFGWSFPVSPELIITILGTIMAMLFGKETLKQAV